MLIAFGITAAFRPCLLVPDDAPPAAPVWLLEEEDEELPQAAIATAAASTGIQRMPLMRMGASPCRRSGDELDAGEGRAGRKGVRRSGADARPVRWPAGPPRVGVSGGTRSSSRPP